MRIAGLYAGGATAIIKRDALVFASYRMRFVGQIASACLSVVLFYYISRLVTVSTFASADAYFAFAVIGIVILEVLTATLSLMPLRLRQELVAGTFERLVVSPFGALGAVMAMTVFPFVAALAQGFVTLVFAAVIFGMPVRWETAPLSLPVAVLGALAFAPFVLFVVASVLLFKQAGTGVGFLMTGISLVSGFFFPVALLPDWLEWTSRVQPFTPALELLRHLLVGTAMPGTVGGTLAKMALFAIVLLPVGMWTVVAALRSSQRQGTVIEY